MASVLRKLRVGLVLVTLLLLAVVGGFVWYGRLMARRWRVDLPKRLGIDITQETNNFTYSQSVKGKTVFTIHAAKEVQHKDGLITLHDVGIVLYGRQDGGSDRIAGKEFEFDPKQGVMRAVGEVFIDLAAAGKAGDKRLVDARRIVHVKTSGLVFDQKAQTARTAEAVEFMAGELKGTAVGAEYDSGLERLELGSAVHVSGLERDRPVVLTAGRAELRRRENLVLLDGARYNTASESAAADHAAVHLAGAGSPREGGPEKIEGSGHVLLRSSDRGTMSGAYVEMEFGEQGKVRAGHLWGGVRYGLEDDRRRVEGQAGEVRVAFDGQGEPVHAEAGGGVRFEERLAKARLAKQTRGLTAARVVLGFSAEGIGRRPVVLKDAVASGGAALRMEAQTAQGRSLTEVRGDELRAGFVEVAAREGVGGKMRTGQQIRSLDGAGRTELHQVGVDGTEETSRGDTLAMSFRPEAGPGAGAGKAVGKSVGGGGMEIERTVQRGGVSVVRVVPARAVPVRAVPEGAAGRARPAGGAGGAGSPGPEVERAWGDEAAYEGDADRLTLRGRAQVARAGSVLQADQVAMERGSGDATADGHVRVSYVSGEGKGEPLHILAARAVEKKAVGTAEFFGSAGDSTGMGAGSPDARMWQEGSQVEAAVLSFFQEGKDPASRRMVAHGAREGDLVRAVLVSAGRGGGGKAAPAGGARKAPVGSDAGAGRGAGRNDSGPTDAVRSGPVRIRGRVMTYLEAARTVEFVGKVKVEDGQGEMEAQRAVAFLSGQRPAGAGAGEVVAASGGDLMGGRIERIVATGAVAVAQPGRRGTGEELVYTASDRTFVLTGTRAAPPKVVDEVKGTTTGAALRFRSGDDSVVVSGGAAGEGVRSEMRVRQ